MNGNDFPTAPDHTVPTRGKRLTKLSETSYSDPESVPQARPGYTCEKRHAVDRWVRMAVKTEIRRRLENSGLFIDLTVQQFIPHFPVEAFAVSVLPRAARQGIA